jgi:hypothetical protein
MTFAIAGSALAAVAGIAFDDGLLADLDLPVVAQVPLTAFGGDLYGPGVPDDAAACPGRAETRTHRSRRCVWSFGPTGTKSPHTEF